jgi:polyisoprenoid-binding protein YceI
MSRLSMVGVVLMAACENPAANKTKAVVGMPSAPAPAGTSHGTVAVDTFSITPAESRVEFVGSKVTGSHEGGFAKFAGVVDVVDGRAEKSLVTLQIDVDSVFTDNSMLTEHLKSKDFFDGGRFQTASFISTEVRAEGAGHTVTGNLTLRGVTRSVSFPASIEVGADRVRASAEFVLNRKEFGIVYPGAPDDLIRDEVVLRLSVSAPRKVATRTVRAATSG